MDLWVPVKETGACGLQEGRVESSTFRKGIQESVLYFEKIACTVGWKMTLREEKLKKENC